MNLNRSSVTSTLIWKELKEHIYWLPLGTFIIGATCWIVRPGRGVSAGQDLLATELVTQFAIVTPLLAFALGVAQTYRDLQPAAAAYLRHRCVSSREIFIAKTLTAFAIYSLSILIPVLCMVAWIAYLGMERYPLRPAQVLPATIFSLAAFSLHSAAVMIMTREASWWGTRLLPLAPSIAVLTLFFSLLRTGGLWIAAICAGIAIVWLIWVIAIAWQAWRSSFGGPTSRSQQTSQASFGMPTYLVLGLLICWVGMVMVALGLSEEFGRSGVGNAVSHKYTAVVIDNATSEPYLVTYLQKFDKQTGISEQIILGGDRIAQGKSIDPTRAMGTAHSFRRLSRLNNIEADDNRSDGFFSRLRPLSDTPFAVSYDQRGYLLLYRRRPDLHWAQTISANGLGSPGDLAGKPFTTDPIEAGRAIFNRHGFDQRFTLLVDSHGIYCLTPDPLTLLKLIEQPIESAALLDSDEGRAPRLVLKSGRKLFEFQIQDAAGSDRWYRSRPGEMDLSQVSPDAPRGEAQPSAALSARLINTYAWPNDVTSSGHHQIGWTEDGLLAVAYDRPYQLLRLFSEDEQAKGLHETIAYHVENEAATIHDPDRVQGTMIVSGFFPGLLGLAMAAVAAWLSATQAIDPPLWELLARYPIRTATLLVTFSLVSALAVWLTMRAADRRGLNRSQRFAWYGSVLLLGLAAPLSVVALYRKVIQEACSKCDSPRRVDMATCEHCGADWEPPLREGIEIIDRESSRTYSEGATV